MVDSPRVHGGRREEPDSPNVLRVRREFLCVFHLIHFVGGFLVHEVRGRSVLEC
jgi:hypothetical protein